MKEIINIGIGQAGVQISESLIKLYLGQHYLTNRGTKVQENLLNYEQIQNIATQRTHENLASMFQETQKHIFKPRFMLIDTQPDVINDFLRSELSSALIPSYLHSGKESANTFARGYSLDNFYSSQNYDNEIRSVAQKCDSLEAFVLNHAIEGGSGSGTVTALMEKIEDIFPKAIKTNFIVGVENGSMTSVVGPYNAVLALARIQPYSDTAIVVSNASLHQIVSQNLDIQFPNYQNINALIAQTHSTYTVFNRFNNSTLNCDIQDFKTNLVIYPQIHYAIPSFSPLIPQDHIYKWREIYSEDLMLEKCFDRSCKFGQKKAQKVFGEDKNLSGIILARGDIDANRLARGGKKLMKKNRWVNHPITAPALKIGVSPQYSTKFHQNDVQNHLKKSVISYRSSNHFQDMLCCLNHNFDIMHSRMAFVHWYIWDGMEEMEFSEAREQLACLERDYQDLNCSDYSGGCEEYDWQEEEYY